MINVSEAALKQIAKLKNENGHKDKHLRLFVDSGGCSGFEYGMSFDEEKSEDVKIGQEGIFVLVDPTSHGYLDGCSIDFDDGLTGKGFEINNPNASNTCGCGRSFN